MSAQHRRPRLDLLDLDLSRRPVIWVASALIVVVAVVASIGLFTLGGGGSRHLTALPPTPPSPVASGATSASAPTSTPKKSASPLKCSKPAPAGSGSQPFQICIPNLRVDTAVMNLGLNKDRTVQVPPLSKVQDAGWYKYSAAPGDVGPTVILGHVDSAQYGDGVFFKLGTMRAGELVVLSRADGKIATFRIDRVKEVSKKHFPSDDVYGPTSGPAIRLVTCGGRFDSSTGSYVDNIIAFGTLLSLRNG